MSFYEYTPNNRLYLKSDMLEQGGQIAHGFTSRLGGVSYGKVEGLNLGFRVGDDKDSVLENYRLLAKDLEIDLNRTVLSKQTHTDNIRIVTEDDCGKGVVRPSDIEDTDGLITNIPKIALVVFTADCVPVLLYDPRKAIIAAVHAGWRGTVKHIAPKAVKIMCDKFGSQPDDIRAAIGPSIGPCCFEFGEDAVIHFPENILQKKQDGKYLVDLWSYNKLQLTEAGVRPENIDISKVCTACESDRFYSYRTHRERTGRQGAVIMLK